MFCFFAKFSLLMGVAKWCPRTSQRRWLNNFLSLSKVKTLQKVQQLPAVLCLQQSSVFWTDISWPEPDWDPSLFLFYHFPYFSIVFHPVSTFFIYLYCSSPFRPCFSWFFMVLHGSLYLIIYFIEGNLLLRDICLKFGGILSTPSILYKRGAFVSFLRDE